GSVTFTLSAGTTGGLLSAASCTMSAGSCSVTFSGPAPGTATVNATYSGDSTHHISAAKTLASITVVLDSTTTAIPSITCNIATAATSCTAPVVVTVTDLNTTSNTPTGTVNFALTAGTTGGSLSVNSCNLSAAGSCSVIFTGTSVGSGSITASYTGDSTHKGSTSTVTIITVTKGANFGISASRSSVTMVVGTSSKINVTFTPISGFTGSITLTNSTTPAVGLTLACNSNPVALSAGSTNSNSTCTIAAASAGTYSLTITGTSTSPSISNSLATPITVTITKANPIITTQLVNATNNQPLGPSNGAATITVGTSVYDTAAIIGGFFVTGSATYNFYNYRDCTGSAFPTTVTISNQVIPNLSPTPPFSTAGFHGFTVTYAGDGNNTGTSGTCESLIVNALPVPSFTVTNQPVYQAQASSYYLPGTTLSFNASSSYDPDSAILSDSVVQAIWAFGDGSGPVIRTTTTGLVNHTYTAVGSYKVTLKVTDNNDGTNSTSSTIVIVVPEVKIVSYHLSSASPTIGDRLTLTIDILNNGLLPLTFNVTMTVASISAGTAQTVDQQQVTLAPNQENSAITLYWDTRGFSAESYTVVIRLVNARVNGSHGTPVSLLTSSQGAGSVALSPQGTSQLPGGNTLWITVGIVAAVATILGVTAILLRRRKIPTP
ncbi:MAG TPA: Ig-like domain repeat protein, partial [Candidatus Angelobacter sp.]|nr:Ig-like domain repeat protein [Candidatus Angelobacter sp.]